MTATGKTTAPGQSKGAGTGSTPAPAPACAFPIGADTCRQPATSQLPVGYASNADPLPLCALHAPRFLGAAVPLP